MKLMRILHVHGCQHTEHIGLYHRNRHFQDGDGDKSRAAEHRPNTAAHTATSDHLSPEVGDDVHDHVPGGQVGAKTNSERDSSREEGYSFDWNKKRSQPDGSSSGEEEGSKIEFVFSDTFDSQSSYQGGTKCDSAANDLSWHLNVRQQVCDVAESNGGEQTKSEGEISISILAKVLLTQVLDEHVELFLCCLTSGRDDPHPLRSLDQCS